MNINEMNINDIKKAYNALQMINYYNYEEISIPI